MNEEKLLSHEISKTDSVDAIINQTAKRIMDTGDLKHVTVSRELEILEELSLFPLGRFLLQNKGVNGYWTHQLAVHSQQGRLMGTQDRSLTSLEEFIFHRAPTMKATQQRFVYFQRCLQGALRNDAVLASVPCGLMADLLFLDFSKVQNVKLVGIDLDQSSLDDADRLAHELGLQGAVTFIRQDAWQLVGAESFHALTSNGLNIYESDDNKVIELYQRFFQALAPGGVLVTSFATPPPSLDGASPWDMSRIDQDDLLLQTIIFSDIVKVKWQCFRTVEQTNEQLKAAGFSVIDFIYDDAKMTPTVIARK
jgi:hypothetical protein